MRSVVNISGFNIHSFKIVPLAFSYNMQRIGTKRALSLPFIFLILCQVLHFSVFKEFDTLIIHPLTWMDFSSIGQSLCNTAYSQLRQTCLFIVFPHKKGFLKGYGSLFMNRKGGFFLVVLFPQSMNKICLKLLDFSFMTKDQLPSTPQ